jgi:hypothetical protein
MEFGTVPIMQVMTALRAEQWLVNHPQTPKAQAEQIKRDLRDAFYVDTPQWKQQIVEQAMQAMAQGVDGLARSTAETNASTATSTTSTTSAARA